MSYPITVDEVKVAYADIGKDYTIGAHINDEGVCPLTAIWAQATRAFDGPSVGELLVQFFGEERGLSADFVRGFAVGFDGGMPELLPMREQFTDDFWTGVENGAAVRQEIHLAPKFMSVILAP